MKLLRCNGSIRINYSNCRKQKKYHKINIYFPQKYDRFGVRFTSRPRTHSVCYPKTTSTLSPASYSFGGLLHNCRYCVPSSRLSERIEFAIGNFLLDKAIQCCYKFNFAVVRCSPPSNVVRRSCWLRSIPPQ